MNKILNYQNENRLQYTKFAHSKICNKWSEETRKKSVLPFIALIYTCVADGPVTTQVTQYFAQSIPSQAFKFSEYMYHSQHLHLQK